MNGPLSGIKVVELAQVVAAPVAGRLMADMGAEVVKIETATGDLWRYSGVGFAPRFKMNENPVFDIYNTGKKLASLNLKTEEGKEALHRLLKDADVLITNFRPAALERLGLDHKTLMARYPRLIYAALLGYGEKGPIAGMPAYDTSAFWSKSGFSRDMSPVTDEYVPANMPSGVGDSATGMLLLAEICTALYNRETTGKGDYVKSGLLHNGAFCMGSMVIAAQRPNGAVWPKKREDIVPGGAYKCADNEWIFFAIAQPTTLPRILDMIGCGQLLQDPRFDTPEKRTANKAQLREYLVSGFLQKTADEWDALAPVYDVPLVRVSHFSDVTKDEQAWANGFLEHVTFPTGNVDIMPTSPIDMDSACPAPTKPVGAVGSDTVEVLKSLGYSDSEIEAMLASGAAKAAQ